MNGHSTLIAAALCVLLGLPSASFAQGGYFGRNKVQYREFDFKVLKTDHFDIYYYPEEEPAAQMASRMAERWYTRLSQLLNHQLSSRQPLILYASGSHFRQTNTVSGELGEGTGGVTEAYKRRIVLPFAGPIEASDHVLGHELVHAFQYDITGTNVSSGSAGALAMPLWFIEGMAEYLSIGPVDPLTAMWMREATRREQLPTVDKLDNPKYFPYRYGQALWAYIAGKYGDGAVGNMLRAAAGRDATYSTAIESVLQIDTKTLTTDWHNAEFEAFRPIAEATKMPAAFARPLITQEKHKGDLNIGPELSPDGSRLIYFSERDMFSIDLFVADARTGEVIKKITNTATSAHYDSLSFLTSAGSWDPAGKRFVFPAISKGERDPQHRRRRARPHRARDQGEGSERDRQSRLVAGRQADRVLGTDRRLHRPLRLRPREGHRAAADERCLRRDGSGLVTRRQADCVQHGSLHDQSRNDQARAAAPGADGRLDRRRHRARRIRRCQEHQPALDA